MDFCFKSLSLWSFVTAVIIDSYSYCAGKSIDVVGLNLKDPQDIVVDPFGGQGWGHRYSVLWLSLRQTL